MKDWLRYVIALSVGVHGFVYLRVEQFVPSQLNARQGSMLLSGVLGSDGARPLVAALDVATGVTVIACAVAIAAARSAPGWWRPLAIASALLGLVAFAVFFDGQVDLLFEEGAIGAVISLVLLVGAIALGRAACGVNVPRSETPRL